MNRRACLISGGSFVAGLAGCSKVLPASDDGGASTPSAAEAIELLDHEYDPTDPGVVGRLENTGSRTVSIVNITATFYDSTGARLAEWTTNVGTVEPGMVVRFTAPYPDDETATLVDDYDLAIDEDMTWYE